MSFNPQGYQFTALPTNLRGKIQPNQLAVLWVIQSYANKDDQQCWPSLKTIAENACLSKRTAQKVVNQLVSLGLLERTHQIDERGQQSSNLYKVTVWHLANVPEPSIERRGKSCTPAPNAMSPGKNLPCPIAADATKLDTTKLDTKELKKKTNKKDYSDDFLEFWFMYLDIKKRASGQNKPKAWEEWKKAIRKTTPVNIKISLIAAIKQQRATEKDGGFAVCFPNCFRWLRDESYEGYVKDEKYALYKQKMTDTTKERPWEKDKPTGQDVPF